MAHSHSMYIRVYPIVYYPFLHLHLSMPMLIIYIRLYYCLLYYYVMGVLVVGGDLAMRLAMLIAIHQINHLSPLFIFYTLLLLLYTYISYLVLSTSILYILDTTI